MTKKSINKTTLQRFTFPEHNIVIEAESIEKAIKKLKILLTK